jgi:phenylalanyl-tRNA synthetase beta subunit
MRLSDQALGALMMSLQKSLLEQTDITEILKSFEFTVDDTDELIVTNPPVVKFDFEEDA